MKPAMSISADHNVALAMSAPSLTVQTVHRAADCDADDCFAPADSDVHYSYPAFAVADQLTSASAGNTPRSEYVEARFFVSRASSLC
jgi:hypothetical protein